MAAKQGTLAQLSATAEETKRAVLSKTGAASWFSNLNTVCTIKSAPPRSPDVLKLLATKSGWLYKRNEQHNWQARWCCVVPHMFLYYFDTNAVSGSVKPLEYPTHAKQEEWNHAVREGLGRSKHYPHHKRSKFPFSMGHHPTGANTAATNNTTSDDPLLMSSEGMPMIMDDDTANIKGVAQPAGIIDLECYSCLHRSIVNPAVLELAGDDKNPDLRHFYFCCENESDQEEWNAALLNHRHSSILDEVDAYKQVADGFAQQLQSLHCELDDLKQTYEECQAELYSVRSASEETRRAVLRSVEECWERQPTSNHNITMTNLSAKRHELQHGVMETLRTHPDMGVHASVRVLVEYIALTEDLLETLVAKIQTLEHHVQNTGASDQAAFDALAIRHEQSQLNHQREIAQYHQQLEAAKLNAANLHKELQDLQKDLSSTKMEVTMLMSQQRNKLAKQQQDKKILRTAVIELRQKLEEANSQNSALSHELEKLKLQYTTEQGKAELLARYVDKMESQVQVQQSMMEMMSQAGGSVYIGGGGGGSVANRSQHSNSEFIIHRQRSHHQQQQYHHRQQQLSRETDVLIDAMDDLDDDDEDHNDDDDDVYSKPPIPPMSSNASAHQRRLNSIMASGGGGSSADYVSPPLSSKSRWKTQTPTNGYNHNDTEHDNKSHMSELTEDRTQREILKYASYDVVAASSPSPTKAAARQRKRLQEAQLQQQQQQHATPTTYGPPTVIIGVKKPESPYSDNRDETTGSSSPKRLQQPKPLQQEQTPPQLETIGGTSSTVTGVVKNTYMRRKQQQQYREVPRAVAPGSVSSSELTVEAGKLSVAQKSRLEADCKTTMVRPRLGVPQRESTTTTTTVASSEHTAPSTESVSSSRNSIAVSCITNNNKSIPKQQQPPPPVVRNIGHIWKRVEEAVLGPAVPDDDDENSISSGTSQPQEQQTQPETVSIRSPPAASPEQDAPDGLLSLQERRQLQREKQLRFLRDQGLIRNAADLTGGAGADGTASVTSSTASSKRPFSIKNSMRHST